MQPMIASQTTAVEDYFETDTRGLLRQVQAMRNQGMHISDLAAQRLLRRWEPNVTRIWARGKLLNRPVFGEELAFMLRASYFRDDGKERTYRIPCVDAGGLRRVYHALQTDSLFEERKDVEVHGVWRPAEEPFLLVKAIHHEGEIGIGPALYTPQKIWKTKKSTLLDCTM